MTLRAGARRGHRLSRAAVTAAALLAVSIIFGAAAPALADDHAPPTTELLKTESGKVLQKGLQGSYCWLYPTIGGVEGEFTDQCVDYVPRYRKAEDVRPRTALSIRIQKPQEPADLSLVAYEKRGGRAYPAGPARSLRPALRPVLAEDGQTSVAWDVVFKIRGRDANKLIHLYGRWEDEDGSGRDQTSSYTFHVATSGRR